ncbi:MAG: DUF5518 domain-containing protein [Halobacteriales archaeon]|nr:DUF5518 domain-containing protein [Halobacteriales archaeon]
MTDDFEGKTLINIIIGAVVTLVVSFVPVVQALAPAVGGGVAGYLQKRGVGGGLKVGTGVALVFMIPAVLFIVAFSGFIAAMVPGVGAGMMAGTFMFVILLIIFFWTLVLAVIGGVVGGAVAGESEKGTSREGASGREGGAGGDADAAPGPEPDRQG